MASLDELLEEVKTTAPKLDDYLTPIRQYEEAQKATGAGPGTLALRNLLSGSQDMAAGFYGALGSATGIPLLKDAAEEARFLSDTVQEARVRPQLEESFGGQVIGGAAQSIPPMMGFAIPGLGTAAGAALTTSQIFEGERDRAIDAQRQQQIAETGTFDPALLDIPTAEAQAAVSTIPSAAFEVAADRLTAGLAGRGLRMVDEALSGTPANVANLAIPLLGASAAGAGSEAAQSLSSDIIAQDVFRSESPETFEQRGERALQQAAVGAVIPGVLAGPPILAGTIANKISSAREAASAGMPATADTLAQQAYNELTQPTDEATGVSPTQEQPTEPTVGKTLDELISEVASQPASAPDLAGVTTTEEVINEPITDEQASDSPATEEASQEAEEVTPILERYSNLQSEANEDLKKIWPELSDSERSRIISDDLSLQPGKPLERKLRELPIERQNQIDEELNKSDGPLEKMSRIERARNALVGMQSASSDGDADAFAAYLLKGLRDVSQFGTSEQTASARRELAENAAMLSSNSGIDPSVLRESVSTALQRYAGRDAAELGSVYFDFLRQQPAVETAQPTTPNGQEATTDPETGSDRGADVAGQIQESPVPVPEVQRLQPEQEVTDGGVTAPTPDISNPRSFKFSEIAPPETVDDWMFLREIREAAEKKLLQEEIGVNDDQASVLHRLIFKQDGTGESWAKKNLNPEQYEKFDLFFEESPYNQRGGPVDFFQYDDYYNPDLARSEKDKDGLSKDLVLAFTNGMPEEGMNDKWVFTVTAIRRLQELGATREDISNQLRAQAGRVAGSQSTAEEWYRTHGAEINNLIERFAPDMPVSSSDISTPTPIEDRAIQIESSEILSPQEQPATGEEVGEGIQDAQIPTQESPQEEVASRKLEPEAEFTRLATRGTGENPTPSEIDKIVTRLGVPVADVQDVSQEVAVKAAQSFNPEGGTAPLTWVNRVAQSTVADYFRRQSAQKRDIAATVSTETPITEEVTVGETLVSPTRARTDFGALEVAVEALDELTETERDVLQSVVMRGDSQVEVASRLGISKERVSGIQRGALKKMRQKMMERGVSRDDIGFDEDVDFPNMGPGAANVREALARYEERKFGKRFVEDKEIAEEIRNNFGELYYEPIPNKVTASEAQAYIDANGVAQAINAVKNDRAMDYRSRVTMGQILIKRLNQSYNSLKQSDPEAANIVLDQAVNLSESVAALGTELGQGVQAFAMWSRLTPDGKLLEYRRAVNKSRDRHKKANEADIEEIINTANEEGMTDKEKIAALKALLKKNKVLRQAKNKIDEIIKAAKDGQLNDQDLYNIIADRLGLPSYSPEIADKIRDLAVKIDEAAEGIPKDTATLELAKYMAKLKGFAYTDLPMMVFYGNILSGYNTQLVNFLDTLVNVNSEVTGLAMANPKAAMQIFSGLARGLKEGKYDALLALTQGRMATQEKWMEVPRLGEVAEFGTKGGVPISTNTKAGRVLKRLAESRAAVPLNAYKYVGRLMSASDAIMARGAKEASAALQAYRMSEQEGLSGDALNKRVQEILALTKMPDFLAQAKQEGFTGGEAQARAIELRELFRDDLISERSSEFAGEATYNHEPHGILGMASSKAEGLISELAKASPAWGLAARTILPFTRIVANVTNRGLNYTPWGYKRAFFGYTGEGQLTQDQRAATMARANIGMMGLTILGVLQGLGILTIHGAGPSDRERKLQMQNAGWKPYSIQIGDTYYNYTYTPIGLMLSIIGNTADSERYGELSNKDALTRATYAVSRLGSTVFSQSFLSSLSGLFDALSDDPGRATSGIRSWVSRTVGAFTTPNIVRDVQKWWDPTLYNSEGIAQDVLKNTPFAAYALNPVLNAFGEPVQPPRQRFISTQKIDPAWKLVLDKGLRIPVPSRSTRQNPKLPAQLTQDQYYKYLKESGQQLKQWITTHEPILRNFSDEEAQAAVDDASRRIRANILPRIRSQSKP